jgi:hypothetical protein
MICSHLIRKRVDLDLFFLYDHVVPLERDILGSFFLLLREAGSRLRENPPRLFVEKG